MSSRIFESRDNFPAFEYTSIATDTAGFPWFFSSEYVTRFDGYQLHLIKLDTTPIITFPRRIMFSKNNDLFIITNDFKLFKKRSGSDQIIEIEFNHYLSGNLSIFEYHDSIFLFDKFRNLFFYEYSRNAFVNDEHSIFSKIIEGRERGIEIIESDGKNALVTAAYENGIEELIFVNHKGIEKIRKVDSLDFTMLLNKQIINLNEEIKEVFYISPSQEIKLDKPKFLDFSEQYRRKVLPGYNGISYFGFTNPSNPKMTNWMSIDTSSTIKFIGAAQKSSGPSMSLDRRNNIWQASHNGLIKYNPYILHFSSANPEMVSSVHAFVEDGEGRIWIGGYYNEICYYFEGKLHPSKENKFSILPGAYAMADGNIWFNAENYTIISDGLKFKSYKYYEGNKEIIASAYCVFKRKNGELAVGLSNLGLGLVQHIEKDKIHVRTIGSKNGLELRNVLCIEEDLKGRLWLGRSSKGIAVYDPIQDTTFSYLLDINDPLSFGAMSMTIDKRDNLWFGGSNGIYFLKNPEKFELANDELFTQTKNIKLPNGDQSLVTFIKLIDDYIVFGNNSAVSFIPLDQWYDDPKSCPVYQLYYGEDIEGEGSEQNMIFQDSKGYLWVGSQKGVSRINIRDFEFDKTKNKISINNILSGSQKLEINNNSLTVPSDNRNILMEFGPANNSSLLKNVFFDYLLISENGDTLVNEKFNQRAKVNIPNFSPGNYSINIIAYKHGLLMDQVKLQIRVPYGFLENPVLRIIISVLLTAGFAFLIINRNRQKKLVLERDLKLSKIKQEKNQLHLQSIISSFNPHFINNSLHWVQSRYRKDAQMVDMIGSLSENIRYIFRLTRQGKATHLFIDEMKLVDNYVSIQLIRFRNTFIFKSLDLDQIEKIKHFKLPILQLQIHIENAIEHGLRNRQESSFVALEIEESDHFISFMIIDDGCGRTKAASIESNGTQTGTKMLLDLHELFNSLEENENIIQTQYEDDIFKNKNGVKYGTRVIIKIPKKFTYEV
jgi:ligand-binding sensor domain-containing protein